MKKKISRTDETVHADWLFGGNPNAIERQEEQGQQELVNGSQLPRYLRGSWKKEEAIEDYLKLGIEVWIPFKGKMSRIFKAANLDLDKDALFISAKLPDGWKLEATDHSMWSHLLDVKGNKRASIFYKAAFYDRDAFIAFENRYGFKDEYLKGQKDVHGLDMRIAQAYDFKDNKALWQSEPHGFDESDANINAVNKYLTDNFPDYKNPHAYWD